MQHEACGRPLGMVQPLGFRQKETDGRDPPQGVAPHAHRGVVRTHNYAGDFYLRFTVIMNPRVFQ